MKIVRSGEADHAADAATRHAGGLEIAGVERQQGRDMRARRMPHQVDVLGVAAVAAHHQRGFPRILYLFEEIYHPMIP